MKELRDRILFLKQIVPSVLDKNWMEIYRRELNDIRAKLSKHRDTEHGQILLEITRLLSR